MNYPWYHGKISRQRTEDLLLKSSNDGAFLVRQSESVANAHVLSMWCGGMVHHFRILKHDNEYTVRGDEKSLTFSNLEDVIEFFKKPEKGLVCPLSEAIDDDEKWHGHDGEKDETDSSPNGLPFRLIEKMSKMDMSGFDSDFSRKLQNYLNNGLLIDTFKKDTSAPMTALQELIAEFGEGLKGEMKDFLRKITFMQELFNLNDGSKLIPGAPGSIISKNQAIDVSDFDDMCNDFARCLASVKSLRTLVMAQKMHEENNQHEAQTRMFQVSACGNFKSKSFIKIDITEGNLWFMKNEKDSLEDSNVMGHDKILQLVKDEPSAKLTFKIDTKSNREYLFKNIQERENFFQLVYFLKNHSPGGQVDPKEITVFVGTWNMGSAPAENIESWITSCGQGEVITNNHRVGLTGHDIYAIGTQESSIGENTWVSKLRSLLKKKLNIDYYNVAVQSLWGIRIVILVKASHRNRISHVERSCVKTGIANKLGNKGGVGVSFMFMSTSFCFINTHLASGNERIGRRKQNYVDILKGLNLGHKSTYDLVNQFHHVFWFGDLNYRIDLDIEVILKAIKEKDYKTLIVKDQLELEKNAGRVFFGFDEHSINFPPTYRYKRGSRDEYEHIKVKRSGTRINVPSWCDRVLWKSFPQLPVKQISYGCTNDILTSDHSPVFASFEVPITSQSHVASQDQRDLQSINNPSCQIIFQSIEAQVQTRSNTNFYLEFHSGCLASSVRSGIGVSFIEGGPRVVNTNPAVDRCTRWNTSDIPELNPILDGVEYLKEQHIMIAVKSESGDESYGECVLSLKSHIFLVTQQFTADLSHGGIKSGTLRGSMNVVNLRNSKRFERLSKTSSKGKLETVGYRKNPKVQNLPSYRPISCISPSASQDLESISRKSLSLGRPTATDRGLLVHDTHNNIPKKTPKLQSQATDENTSEGKPLLPLPSKKPEVLAKSPPPLPVKVVHSFSFPTTVGQFLSRLGLDEYLAQLKGNGFENLLFMEDISHEDLLKIGISNTEHVTQILREIAKLKKSGFFRS